MLALPQIRMVGKRRNVTGGAAKKEKKTLAIFGTALPHRCRLVTDFERECPA
jgi:hypothetical protein